MFAVRNKIKIISIVSVAILFGLLLADWLPYIPAPHALALTTEYLKPTDYTLYGSGTFQDPTNAYDFEDGDDGSTYCRIGVGDNDADPTVEFYTWETSSNNHSERRLYYKRRGRGNGGGSNRDLWSSYYSTDGGESWTPIEENMANTTKGNSPVVYIPTDVDLSQLQFRISTFLVGPDNGGHIRLWDVWLECDFTSFPLVGTQIGGSYPLEVSPTTLTPQEEWTTVTVPVWHGENLGHIDAIEVKLFYDSAGNDPSESGFSANAQTCAILTWTRGGGPEWDIDPSSSTWAINSSGCSKPSDTVLQGDWVFSFKVGKVATYSSGAGDWDIFAEALDYNYVTSSDYLRDTEMNYYSEIVVNTASVSWSGITPGTDFGESTKETDISVTYISNGPCYERVASTGNWTGVFDNAELNTSGSPGSMEFSIKAESTDNLTTAALVTAYPTYVTIDNTGTQTSETGDTVATNTLWLKLGYITNDTFSGTIYYMVSNSP